MGKAAIVETIIYRLHVPGSIDAGAKATNFCSGATLDLTGATLARRIRPDYLR
jgi:hypothetical protein